MIPAATLKRGRNAAITLSPRNNNEPNLSNDRSHARDAGATMRQLFIPAAAPLPL